MVTTCKLKLARFSSNMEPECGNKNDQNNPHPNFFKGTVLEDKEIGLGIKDKGERIRHKGYGSSFNGKEIRPKWSLTLKTKSCMSFFMLIFTISSRALLNLKG